MTHKMFTSFSGNNNICQLFGTKMILISRFSFKNDELSKLLENEWDGVQVNNFLFHFDATKCFKLY